ncbi:glycosyltransferase family 4 protein [Halolamina rubra]|uniref:glycosyltransferase family 4 protein n=1 Tax=Halolamina rubra TaxID=1380430 RepID=UPI0009E2C077|nr:glycosyltransferase family 4 protein [Halolamina rubra]
MKVSVLTPDLSHNCLGRAHLLSQLLERNYEVEIIGPKLQDEIWAPVRNDYEYKGIDTGNRIYEFAPDIPDLINLIDGDVVLASKPRVQSYGVALLAGLSENRPLILDIDDWETAFKLQRGKLVAMAWGIPTLINTGSYYYHRALEALSGLADARTVSNRFLQKKFGGELIPHARDTDLFDPEQFDKMEAREAYDLPRDATLVMFSGTPRPHKGVADLVSAVASIDKFDVRTVVVGAHESKFVNELRDLGGESLILRGQQPFEEIPRWLAAADVVAIPQKESTSTRGQLPAKVFDAMAMGKPVIATEVGDLPRVLGDGGEIVSPDSPASLADAISRLTADESRRSVMGNRARDRCVKHYSYDALAPKIAEIVTSIQ